MSALVVISAEDEVSLVAELRRIIGYIDRFPETSLADLAYTCALQQGDSIIAIIASDIRSLRARLSSAADRIAGGNVRRLRDKSGTYYFREHLLGAGGGKLAFVYPGVLSFYPDMMRDLAIKYPECRGAFDELEEAMAGDSGFTPSSFIFPPAPYYRQDADIFKSGAYAQALVSTYAGCVAMTRLLRVNGLNPDGVVGFAGGDLAAMMRSGAAGATPTRPERVKMISDIYQIVAKAVNHGGMPQVAMITVVMRRPGEADAVVAAFPPGKAVLAVDFSPRQKTYAIDKDFKDAALMAFAMNGIRATTLALDRPFNTPMCESLVPAIYKFATRWMKHDPVYDVYSCATADLLPSWLRSARKDMSQRWAKPVRFVETVRKMYADGYRVFLEVGPRGLMTAAISDTLKGENHAAIALNSIHRSGVVQLQHAIGQLVAQGARINVAHIYSRNGAKQLDFDSKAPIMVRKDTEMRLDRVMPKLQLFSQKAMDDISAMTEIKGKGAKAKHRNAVVAKNRKLRQQQMELGTNNPMISDADIVSEFAGSSIEISKKFRVSDMPFIGDSALGTSQMSYVDPNLKGLVLLTLPIGAEIMAEAASMMFPNGVVVRIDDLNCWRWVAFVNGELSLSVKAERVSSGVADEIAVKVQIREQKRDESLNSAYTRPAMEALVIIVTDTDKLPTPYPMQVEDLEHPQGVHWSGRDIYPSRLYYGKRLRGIQFVDSWGISGVDYSVKVPSAADNVIVTMFPSWAINPLLMEIIVDGFKLWRSHEKFTGAFSFPFRLRRLALYAPLPTKDVELNCYMRHTGVTEKSQTCDFTVTDRNGMVQMTLSGWEELTERVPAEYCELVLQPATSFISKPLRPEIIGTQATDVASAAITDINYAQFARNEELWLKTVSNVVLDATERREFVQMTGSTDRRTEWLFGRIAAKEAVRRYLKDFYQSRWSDADIRIWADDSGKPHALGRDWRDFLSVPLDIAISHTNQFIVAIAAANHRVGVDVEYLNRDLSEEFARGAFNDDELELAKQSVIKFWCAKEAVSKALGTGIRYSPREMRVVDYHADNGGLAIRLERSWAEAFKKLRGRDISVVVKTVRDHVVASCFIPEAMFDE